MIPPDVRQASRSGAVLGIYIANALGAPPLAVIAFITDAYIFCGMMLVASVLGWLGWKRDFDFRWTP